MPADRLPVKPAPAWKRLAASTLDFLTVFAGGSALCAVSTWFPLMLAGRIVQGCGGGIYPLAYGILMSALMMLIGLFGSWLALQFLNRFR